MSNKWVNWMMLCQTAALIRQDGTRGQFTATEILALCMTVDVSVLADKEMPLARQADELIQDLYKVPYGIGAFTELKVPAWVVWQGEARRV